MRRRTRMALGVAGLAMVLVPAALSGYLDDILRIAKASVQQTGLFGFVALVVMQFLVAATGILPASLLGIAGGAVYGFAGGSAMALVGTLAGGIVGYYIGRKGLRNIPLTNTRVAGGLDKVKQFLAADGWRSVFLIRLSPVVPFAATSIALGASGIRLADYVIGTAASLPALFGYVYVGSLLGNAASLKSPEFQQVFLLMLAGGVIAGGALVGRFAMHHYKSETT